MSMMETMMLLLLSHAGKSLVLLVLGAGLMLVLPRRAARLRACLILSILAGVLALPALGVVLPAIILEVPGVTLELPSSAVPARMASEEPGITSVADRSQGLEGAGGSLSTAGWILFVWLAGAVLAGLRLGLPMIRVRGMANRAEPVVTTARLGRLFEAAAKKHGRCRSVILYSSDEAPIPFVWGHRRPMVVVPRWFAEQDEALVRSVLAHELEHVGHRDWIARLIAAMACTVCWYNPLVWRSARQLVIEQERACDDEVVAQWGSGIAYAGHLLEVAMLACSAPAVAAPALARPNTMEDRIMRVLEGNPVITIRWGFHCIVIIALAAIPYLAALELHGADRDHQPVQESQTLADAAGSQVESPDLTGVMAILQADVETFDRTSSSYQSADRRDPFVRESEPSRRIRLICPGDGPLALQADEVRLVGLFSLPGGSWIASLTSVNGTNLIVRQGTALCDARVTTISDHHVLLERAGTNTDLRLEIRATN